MSTGEVRAAVYLPLNYSNLAAYWPVVNEELGGPALLQMCASLLSLQSVAGFSRVRTLWMSTGGCGEFTLPV